MATLSPFESLDEIRLRSADAVIGQSGISHAGLAGEIRQRLASTDVSAGSVLQNPVIESALPYVQADLQMKDLHGLISAPLVEALDGSSDKQRRNYRFRREWKPYTHQLSAWQKLLDQTRPQSVLVTSGTGSGKTECFLIPILADLLRQPKSLRLEGVQAIVLYPLNALIASQEERLREWTAPFQGTIRFGLYNGLTPAEVPAAEARLRPEAVMDRKTLRASPPPILVTNVTMLEYMLLRKDDAPILASSKGKLRYIVLDEAHSYVGAQAAEIALLLRRVCLGFGVEPQDVRFVATSATIGNDDGSDDALRKFLKDVSGAPDSSISVIRGEIRKPVLPSLAANSPLSDDLLRDLDAETAFNVLGAHPAARNLIEQLHAQSVPWTFITNEANRLGVSPALLCLTLANAKRGEESLSPLRIHSFHRSIPGIWSCLNPKCTGHVPADWPFGAILVEDVEECPYCRAPTLEILSCSECGEPFLNATETASGRIVRSVRLNQFDEFAIDVEVAAPDDETEETPPPVIKEQGFSHLLAVRKINKWRPLNIDPWTGTVVTKSSESNSFELFTHEKEQPECCPSCNAHQKIGAMALLRPFRYGAPFLLGNSTPVLLAGAARATADTEGDAATRPMQGRQLLSFTDSRQGTARLSAKLQIGSERNFVRSIVYHAVQDVLHQGTKQTDFSELDSQIAELTRIVEKAPNLQPVLEGLLADRAKRANAGSEGLPLETMVERLSDRPEVDKWIKGVWAPREVRFEDTATLSKFLILREFFRRPRRANTLETLGLARLDFASISSIPDARTPSAFTKLGGTAQDWRDFLNVLSTHLVRANSAVRIERASKHWIQPKGALTNYVQISRDQKAWDERYWPWVIGSGGRPPSRPARPIILLLQAFQLSLEDSEHRQVIQDVLDAAWHALGDALTAPGSPTRALEFSKARLAALTGAWWCPLTRRLLDVAFRGLSPYGAISLSSPAITAAKVAMPSHPAPFLLGADGGDSIGRETVLDWLANNPSLAQLRKLGAWSDISDRIALFSDYFRSAEHSAQQQPRRLRRYEEEFKSGSINVLNCSTTMEMGVDIGSVSHVMMTNVPPSIANYRQRVGRAGRRGQDLSLAFTFCRDRPLDRDVFRDPIGFLHRNVSAPRVALDSRVIVQRHVNALLFSRFILTLRADAIKMKAGPFFGLLPAAGAVEETENSASIFSVFAQAGIDRPEIVLAVERLTAGSVLEGDQTVFDVAAETMTRVRDAFASEWRALQELRTGRGPTDEAAARGITIQLQRLCEDYLLGSLAARGFLPGHGFPTGVVSFVSRSTEPEGEADRSRFRGYPQRALDTAIREYAPGSEVVIDGLVHQSAGVTLNWKRPATDEGVREIQSIRHQWRCLSCGESGTDAIHSQEDVSCPSCGESNVNWRRYLQPAGFAADLRVDPHADADEITYVPSEPAIVSARGTAWTALFDPAQGRRRASREGTVFFCNSGKHGGGYSICLSCGRAEPEENDQATSAPLSREHKPLIGKPDVDGYCSGSSRPFSIQRSLRLGYEISTDAFELQPAGLEKRGAGLALASALREALSRRLGVEPDEMGIAAEERRNRLGGRSVSVFLFDKASGGAGFAVQADDQFADVLKDAEKILDCRVPGCVNGCPSCVLTADMSEDEARLLERGPALAIVRSLAADASPLEEDQVGSNSRLVLDVLGEIERSSRTPGTKLIVRVASPVISSGLAAWNLRGVIGRLRRRGCVTSLSVPAGTVANLDSASILSIRDQLTMLDLELEESDEVVFPNDARLLAEVIPESGDSLAFASRDTAAFLLGAQWGRPQIASIVRFKSSHRLSNGLRVARTDLRSSAGASVRVISNELNGPISGFGQRAADTISSLIDEIGLRSEAFSSILYEDRYLHSPLVARMCIDTLSALAKAHGLNVPITVRTRGLNESELFPRRIEHNWKNDRDREIVFREYAAHRKVSLEFQLGDPPHARQITISSKSGKKAYVLLDQGFGAWRSARFRDFDFRARAESQARQLRGLDFELSMPAEGRTYIVARI
ncbi:DEAD/DEAH box helicase [Bradyrhizobium liaoningense]|uniref:DEAD/DEAH box helicase n=1 Tax=Bradyrhizobium liaoningense TaxID=43992 RepID=UPI001BA7CD87|nr:DEAD/DEAH box helicase [Bradyrhizobium liaoningense]MBR0878556.1 DEAD/DEAH box helicase [Bradyrhizobium liaoningense]